MKLSDKELLRIAGQELNTANGDDNQALTQDRETALNYYFGAPRGDEVEGNSQVQSLDVADQVNAVMAQLAPMMKATLVEFVPNGEADEPQAQLESDFVMHVAGQSNAYKEFSAAAFDALLQSNGWIKVWIDEDTETWTETFKLISEPTLMEKMTPVQPNERITIEKQSTDKQTGLVTVTLRHTVRDRVLRLESIAPEYMLFAPNHNGDLSSIRFVAEKMYPTRSDLLEMGLSKAMVWELPARQYLQQDSETARRQGTSSQLGGDEKATETIECYNCYMRVDYDGDGIAELRRVLVQGSEASNLLINEEARFIPYGTGSALPIPHRTTGMGMYQLLKGVQDSKTMTLRQWNDNQRVANNTECTAVDGQVNMDDLMNPRAGRVIRVRQQGAVEPITFNDIGQSCIQSLQYQDQVRTERGGAALNMMAGEMQVAGSSALAAGKEYGHKETMAAWYCRNLVESIVRSGFLLIHQSLRHFYDDELTAQLHGKWQSTQPRTWPRRRNVRVLAGMSSAERQQQQNALAMNLQYQTQAMQAGLDGELVNAEKIHACLADWLRACDLQNVEEYYLDPASEEAQAARQQKAQAAQQQAQQMEQLQQRVIDQQQHLDKYKHDTELQFKYWNEQMGAAIEEMKIVGQATNDAQLELLKQSGQMETQDNG